MKINIIKSLSNVIEQLEITAGKPAFEVLKNINFDNAVLIVNGKKRTPDYIIKNNDIVTVRILPADLTDMTGNDGWDIFLAYFVIPFGFIIQPAEIASQAKDQAEQAEKELDKIKKLTNGTDLDNRPFLRGASNTMATGKSQPYFCGRNFLTPYLFSKPYYKISGTDGEIQETYTILECGFNGIVLNKIGIGDINIKSFTDEEPQNGVYNINEGVFADGQVEIKQDGELFEALPELNYRVVSNVLNKEIEKQIKITEGEAEHLVFDLDANAKNVELAIKFPYGLYAYNKDNDRIETQVEIIPEYSLDGGANYTAFTFDNGNIFKKNTIKEIRYTAHKEFTLEDYETLYENGKKNILIRVRSNGNDDPKIKNDCYLFYYQSVCYDPNKSSKPAGVLDDNGTAGLTPCLNVEDKERGYSCIMGLKLKATKNNESKLTHINIIATSTARTWDGEQWSETKSPTRNPAAIGLEVLTSPAHPASRYDDSEIDLEAWGALYEKCENDGVKFDYIITQNQRKKDTLEKIATVCNAVIYKDIYGRISVAIDEQQENALAVYNPQNIINITNIKTFARRVDALRIKYVDSENDNFKENTYVVTRTENGQPVELDENSIIKEISATGITEYENIVKYGRRLMAADELRQITTTIQIGFEGVYYTPCAKISLQDPSLNRDAQDAVIENVIYRNGLLKEITLKNYVTFDPAKDYGVIINCLSENRGLPLALKVSGTGTTKTLEVVTEYSVSETAQPANNNILTFGELDENGEFSKVKHDYIITRIARNDNGFSLDLQEYNEAIYDPGVIPAYKPIVNNTPTLEPGEIPIDAITSEQLEQRIDGINGDSVQAAVDTITKGHRFTNIYKVKPTETTLEEIVAKMDDDLKNTTAAISITEDEILLQVSDMQRELVGLIDIQAGAVTALVEGGGVSGQLSLSLELPVVINAETREKFITASSESEVNAVYGLVENTNYYGIKPGATNAAIKTLWNAAVTAGLLASQIDLTATQIHLNAKNVLIDGETIINNANKIKAELIDVENIFTRELIIKNGGSIKSENFNFEEETQGFNLVGDTGEFEAVKAKLKSAEIDNSIVNSVLTIKGDYLVTPTINPNITEQRLRGGIRAMFYWQNGKVKYKTDNIESVTKIDTGTYLVKFNDFTYLANCFGYSLYETILKLDDWTVPAEAKAGGKVSKRFYKIGIVTDIAESLNSGYKIIQNYGTNEGQFNNDVHDFNTHALVYFML